MAHHILVDLLRKHGAAVVHAQNGAETAVVLLHVLHGVAAAYTEVETIPRRGGNAAEACGETVRHALQRLGTEIGNGIVSVLCEHRTPPKKWGKDKATQGRLIVF